MGYYGETDRERRWGPEAGGRPAIPVVYGIKKGKAGSNIFEGRES
jgi:hypothetical protein